MASRLPQYLQAFVRGFARQVRGVYKIVAQAYFITAMFTGAVTLERYTFWPSSMAIPLFV